MLKIKNFFGNFHQNIQMVLREHPLESLWTVFFALPLLFVNTASSLICWYLFPCYFVLMYKMRHYPILYKLAGMVPVLGLLWCLWIIKNGESWEEWTVELILLNVHALLLLIFPFSRKDNRTFLSDAITTIVNLSGAVVIISCFQLAIFSIFGVIKVLFESNLFVETVWLRLSATLAFLLLPLMFILLEKRFERKQTHSNPIIEWTVNYIGVPTMMIYTVLIYLYTLKIMMAGSLPKGVVAYLVCGYLGLGLLTQMFYVLSNQSKWHTFQRFFPYLTIVPLILLWIGIGVRVDEYGLTASRIYLIACASLLSILCVLSLRPQWRHYRVFAMLFLGFTFTLSFLLPIQSMVQNSQMNRFEQLLRQNHLLNDNGTIKHPLVLDKKNNETWLKLREKAVYLTLEADASVMRARYGAGFQQLMDYEDPNSIFSSVQYVYLPEDSISVQTYQKMHLPTDANRVNGTEWRIKTTSHTEWYFKQSDDYLEKVFTKHQMNRKQKYSDEELAKLAHDLTQLPIENGMLIVKQMQLRFDSEKQMYMWHGMEPIAVFSNQ